MEGAGVSTQTKQCEELAFLQIKTGARVKACVPCACSRCRQRPGVERGRRDVLQQLGDARRGLVCAVSKLLLLDPEQQRPVEAGILQKPHAWRHLQEASR